MNLLYWNFLNSRLESGKMPLHCWRRSTCGVPIWLMLPWLEDNFYEFLITYVGLRLLQEIIIPHPNYACYLIIIQSISV